MELGDKHRADLGFVGSTQECCFILSHALSEAILQTALQISAYQSPGLDSVLATVGNSGISETSLRSTKHTV